jgi:hypothetical protein
MYSCQLSSCLKLNIHDSEGSPVVTLKLPWVVDPMPFNKSQAAWLTNMFPLALPRWMLTMDNIGRTSCVPTQGSKQLPPRTGLEPTALESYFISFPSDNNKRKKKGNQLKPSEVEPSPQSRRRGRCHA